LSGGLARVRSRVVTLFGALLCAFTAAALVAAELTTTPGTWIPASLIGFGLVALATWIFRCHASRHLGKLQDSVSHEAETLARHEARRSFILDGSPDVIIHLDPDGRCAFVNDTWNRLLGTEPPRGALLVDSIHPEDRPAFLELLERREGETCDAGGGGPVSPLELRVLGADGEARSMALHLHRADPQSDLRDEIAMLRDLTPQREAQQEISRYRDHIVESKENSNLAYVAGGVAHEFNNLLSAILGFATHAQRAENQDPEVTHALAMIEKSAQRGASLTQSLLSMTHPGSPRVEAVDVGHCLEQVSSMLCHHLDDRHDLRIDVTPDLPKVLGDASRIEHAVLNLCLNAREIMPEGGSITIRAAPWRSGLRSMVQISVIDTGPGIPPEIQSRLFEPFVTTKGRGQGIGLGLALVWNVARSLGGWVRCVSRRNHGSTFNLLIPTVDSPDPVTGKLPICPAEEVDTPRSATILVAEDEPAVRELLSMVLEPRGYRVLLAEDGWQALDLFDRHQDEIDLIILDLVMPQVGGEQVYAHVRQHPNPPRILVSSGYSEQGKVEMLLEQGADGFLPKPYRVTELVSKVDELLAAVARV
jgi:PAS domain S-box-containing protein